MSYKITEEEKNRVKMNSPFSLPLSPSERGMKPDAIKEMFWKAFNVLIDIINKHLEGLETAVNEHEKKAEAGITEHNKEVSAHEDIRKAVTTAYNLAAGKSRVHPVKNWQEMCTLLLSKSVGVGDLIIIAEKGYPDFAVQAVNTEAKEEDILFFENTENVHIEPGSSYYFQEGKIRLLSLESGIDLNKLVSRDEYNFLNEQLLKQIFLHDVNAEAHADIRQMIVGVANSIDGAYKNAGAALDRANSAYNLATGKTKVHVVPSFSMMITELINMGAFAGDIFLIFDKNTPDFIVIGNGEAPGAISITRDDMGALPSPEVGAIYCVEGISVAAIESGIDTDALATKEELNGLINSFSGVLDNLHEYAQALVANGKEVA